jgi:glycosyltransferase involved in cell wall biosynthesis
MNSRQPIAICVVTYKQGAFLEQAVRSCYAQTYRPVEVWVSDDASPDETPEIMARLQKEFPDLLYHRHSVNLGMVGNYDWILRQPTTEYIAMLDSDDVLAPRFVETLAVLLDKHADAGYGHVALQYIDAGGKFLKESRLARVREYLPAEQALKGMTLGQKANPSLRMFRRKALEKVDFFRGRPPNVQDYDLAVSMADAGYGNVYCPEILGSYRVWGGMQWTMERTRQAAEGLAHIYGKTLSSAFRRRGWSERPLQRARRKQAANMVPALRALERNSRQRQDFARILFALSPAWQTRIRIRLVDYLPYKMFRCFRGPTEKAKRAVKRMLLAKRAGSSFSDQ